VSVQGLIAIMDGAVITSGSPNHPPGNAAVALHWDVREDLFAVKCHRLAIILNSAKLISLTCSSVVASKFQLISFHVSF
jgi:hypothetical protein